MTKKYILPILLCISIFISSIMINPIAVEGETTANSNNWSNSDVREFLNGSGNDNSSGYASHFTDAEYDVITENTITTNGGTSTDKFYLPGYVNRHVTSWGGEEVEIKSPDKEGKRYYIIPMAYWEECKESKNWLRSAVEDDNSQAFVSRRAKTEMVNGVIEENVESESGVAPLFHIDMKDVIFASVASAANLLQSGDSAIAQKFKIEGSDNFGQIRGYQGAEASTPVYGMYLKTKDSNGDFQVKSIEYSNNALSIQYEGADVGKAIVVQMYSEDSLEEGCNSYVAASRLKSASGSCTIDCSDWGLISLDGLVMQVWMEDPKTGISMAKATVPQGFSFVNGSFTKTDSTIKNLRVFAMKEELSCSWGDYTTQQYGNWKSIIAGGTNDSNFALPNGIKHKIGGTQMGPFATNQKIYFGTDSNGNPLVHWIAGHDKTNGNMCLYQAKAVEKRAFDGGSKVYQQDFSITVQDDVKDDTIPCNKIGSSLSLVEVSGGDAAGTITYLSSNPYVATVDASGKVTIKNAGTFEIIAVNSGSDNFYSETIRSGEIVVEDHTGGTATCNKKAVCSTCNSEYGIFDVNNHEYDLTTWKYDATHHWHACSHHQDAVLDKTAHTWSEWTVAKEATTTAEGLKTRSCTICVATENETIPKLTITTPEDDTEQKPEDGETGNGDTEQKPEDGEAGNGDTEQKPEDGETGNGDTEQKPEDGQTGNESTSTDIKNDITVVSPKTGTEEGFVYILGSFAVISGAVMVYKKRNLLKK